MNTHVDFETAKLLKEKGFDIRTKGFYNNGIYVNTGSEIGQYHSFHNGNPKTNHPLIALVPTIAEVVMWLYEKHGIWIYVKHGFGWEYFVEKADNSDTLFYNDGTFNSPTEAYQEAINYTLRNLIK